MIVNIIFTGSSKAPDCENTTHESYIFTFTKNTLLLGYFYLWRRIPRLWYWPQHQIPPYNDQEGRGLGYGRETWTENHWSAHYTHDTRQQYKQTRVAFTHILRNYALNVFIITGIQVLDITVELLFMWCMCWTYCAFAKKTLIWFINDTAHRCVGFDGGGLGWCGRSGIGGILGSGATLSFLFPLRIKKEPANIIHIIQSLHVYDDDMAQRISVININWVIRVWNTHWVTDNPFQCLVAPYRIVPGCPACHPLEVCNYLCLLLLLGNKAS